LQEKIARSLTSHQRFLAASYYGKFFSRKLQLSLLQRQPVEWKTAQTKTDHGPVDGITFAQPPNADQGSRDDAAQTKRKRKRDVEKDEIDVLFDGVKENRHSKVASIPEKERRKTQGNDLEEVLSAIKAAPKGESTKRRKG
jgi:nucleolar protein 9